MNLTERYKIIPTRPDYARQPTAIGFDWPKIIHDFTLARGLTPGQPLYLVVFRSQRRPDADHLLLMEHDEAAHRAARRSPSLLHYFGGEPDAEGYCLSFCIWTD